MNVRFLASTRCPQLAPSGRQLARLRTDAIAASGIEEARLSEPQLLILRHALRHFAQRGYAATNVRRIGAEAGLSAPMVNYHFDSKGALYRRLVDAVLDGLTRSVAEAVKGDALATRVRGVIAGHLAFAKRHPDAFAFVMNLVYGPPAGRPAVPLEELYAGVSNLQRESVTAAVASRRLVLRPGMGEEALLNALDAVVGWAGHRTFKGHEPSDGEIGATLGIVLAGARA